MTRFIIRRSLFGLLVLWIISMVVFGVFFLGPHDPSRALCGRFCDPTQLAAVRSSLGLDQPLPVQYLDFLGRLVHGNFGYSYYQDQSVNDLITSRISVDFSLAFGSEFFVLIFGITIGMIAARWPRSIFDRGTTMLVLVGLSAPTFLIGIALLFVFSFKLPIFPSTQYVGLTQDPLSWASHLILPWLTLAFVTIATYSRLLRGSMLDTLGEDYIRTARAKGVRGRSVYLRHAFRVAMTPIMTQTGIDIATSIGGLVVTEQVFSLPGISYLAVKSVETLDLNVIMGVVMVAAFFIVLANIIVDVMYAVMDPRVRLS